MSDEGLRSFKTLSTLCCQPLPCAHTTLRGVYSKIYTKEHYCWQWSAMDHLVCKPFAVRSWCGIPW